MPTRLDTREKDFPARFDAFLASPKVENLPAVQGGGASPLEGKFKLPFSYQSALDYIKI